MKITDVKSYKLKYPTTPGFADALAAIAYRDVYLCIITTDNGLEGYGEGFALGCLDSVAAAVEESIKPILIGRDPDDLEAIRENIYNSCYRYGRRGIFTGAMSAVDIALWDLRAKHVGVPIYKMLGAHKKR